jgi:hypothetical protein
VIFVISEIFAVQLFTSARARVGHPCYFLGIMSEAPIDDANLFRQSDAVEVRRVTNRGKGGRAVFARRDVREGEIFERVPVLLIPKSQVFGGGEVAQRAGVAISWYVFTWIHPTREYVGLSLGYGSIYNHSETPSAKYQMHLPDVMEFFALREIKAGEEITIDYRGDAAGAKADLGFEASDRAAEMSATPLQEMA